MMHGGMIALDCSRRTKCIKSSEDICLIKSSKQSISQDLRKKGAGPIIKLKSSSNGSPLSKNVSAASKARLLLIRRTNP